MSDITGCIIRVKHNDRAVCQALADEFRIDHTVEVVAPGPHGGWTFYMECMGNLDFENWLLGFATDLRVMRNRGRFPNFGNSLNISIELVH